MVPDTSVLADPSQRQHVHTENLPSLLVWTLSHIDPDLTCAAFNPPPPDTQWVGHLAGTLQKQWPRPQQPSRLNGGVSPSVLWLTAVIRRAPQGSEPTCSSLSDSIMNIWSPSLLEIYGACLIQSLGQLWWKHQIHPPMHQITCVYF